MKKESEMAALLHVVTDCCSVCSGSRVRPVVQVKVPVRVELTEATLAMKTETTTSTARCKRRRLLSVAVTWPPDVCHLLHTV